MDRGQCAAQSFASGYNCAQSVFLAFAGEIGVEQETAARLTNCLGGGIAGSGGTCGALTGAFLALSAKFGRGQPSREGEQLLRQQNTYRLVGELCRQFVAEFGSELCAELLERGLAASGEAADNKFLCPQYVRCAANLAERSWNMCPDD